MLEKLNAVSTAKRLANMVRSSFLALYSLLPFPFPFPVAFLFLLYRSPPRLSVSPRVRPPRVFRCVSLPLLRL